MELSLSHSLNKVDPSGRRQDTVWQGLLLQSPTEQAASATGI